VTVGRPIAASPLAFARESVTALFSYDARMPYGSWRSELLATLATTDGSPGSQDIDRMIPGAGDVEEGLTGLTEVWEQAQELGGGAVQNGTAVNLSDAYLWLLRLHDGIRAGRRGMEQLLAHGYQYSLEFSLVAANTVDCLRLSGDRDAADELVATYLLPEATTKGWPVNMSRAELDLLGDNPTAALAQVQHVKELSHDRDHDCRCGSPRWARRASSARAGHTPPGIGSRRPGNSSLVRESKRDQAGCWRCCPSGSRSR
jgi:hypothetical protein